MIINNNRVLMVIKKTKSYPRNFANLILIRLNINNYRNFRKKIGEEFIREFREFSRIRTNLLLYSRKFAQFADNSFLKKMMLRIILTNTEFREFL